MLKAFAQALKNRVVRDATDELKCSALSKMGQKLLALIYQTDLIEMAEVGLRVYSQTDEDGILLYIFGRIGTDSKLFVEIGCGDGTECNCANLAINHGWHGLFIDSDLASVQHGIEYYAHHQDCKVFPPAFVGAKVSRDNVNQLISGQGFKGEIDLLSIDIDGMDYWIWKAIEVVSPRVVVIEANGKLGMRSITVPYDDNWVYDAHAHPHYHGASLVAMTKLANTKGYKLVATNRFGFNAFYVQRSVGDNILPEVSIESCRQHFTRHDDDRLFNKIAHLPFKDVS